MGLAVVAEVVGYSARNAGSIIPAAVCCALRWITLPTDAGAALTAVSDRYPQIRIRAYKLSPSP